MMTTPIKKHLEINGAEIYHEVYGEEDNPAILLSHAYGCSHAMWGKQIEALSRNHRLILWDMRGHGLTKVAEQKELFSHGLVIEDMKALLDHYGVQQAIIGGLSLGGYMSLMFYHHYSTYVRALLLCDTGPGFRKDEARARWNEDANRQADVLDKRGLGAAPKTPDGVKHYSAHGLALAARYILAQQDSVIIDRLDRIAVPALVVVGADDKPFHPSADYMARKIPQAQKVVVPNAEHYANDDNAETFNRAILDYLASLDG